MPKVTQQLSVNLGLSPSVFWVLFAKAAQSLSAPPFLFSVNVFAAERSGLLHVALTYTTSPGLAPPATVAGSRAQRLSHMPQG